MKGSRRRTDAGQITAMLGIWSVCLLLAIIAVIDISASYLRRQSATSLADGAALAATEAAGAGGIYGDADTGFVPIEAAAARSAVNAYLRDVGAYDAYPGLDVAVRVVGHQVEVALVMPYRLPVRVPGVDATTLIHARGAAELPIY
jgi:hypothetical protein